MTARARLGGGLLGLLLAWAAAATWGGLVLDPGGYLVRTAVVGLLVVLAGAGLRTLRVYPAAVVTAQLLVAGLGLHTAYALDAGTSLLPRPSSVRGLVAALEQGAFVLGTDIAPVDRSVTAAHLLLLGCALLVVWGVDVLAHALRRPPLAGLPVLAAVSVPVTVLLDPVPTTLFVTIGVAYVLLLASDREERQRDAVAVGPPVAGGRSAAPAGGTEPTSGTARERVEAGIGAGQVAVAAVLVALVVAPLVPLADPFVPGGSGSGGGSGGNLRVATQNPFVSLRRDLLEQTDTSMLFARTDSTDTAYVRTVVLDRFDDDSWNASPRDLPLENAADGTMPAPPGLAAGTGGVESEWELRLDPAFSTRWLPLPSPLREVRADGDWRYDERFLDVALPSGTSERGLAYEATAFRPAITAQALDRALTAPESVREPMTEVPRDLPPVIEETAREVVAGARTPYEQAVALQDWFRQDGGFEYSLQERPGSGLDLLARFVTTDKVGYCEQFAAAMAAMGRTLGIPSRVAVGFLGPERLPDGELRYSSDARHAWPEMYFTGVGWVRFEPTPSVRTGASPDYTRQSTEVAAPTQAPEAPTETAQPRSPDADQQQTDTDAGDGAGVSRWWAALALLVLAVGGLAVPRVVRRRQRAARLDPARPDGLAEGAWDEVRATAVDHGVAWDDGRSPREQAQVLVAGTPEVTREDAERLEALLQLVERGRFARPDVRPVVRGRGTAGTALAERAPAPADPATVVATVERWQQLLAARSHAAHPGRLDRARRAVLPTSALSASALRRR